MTDASFAAPLLAVTLATAAIGLLRRRRLGLPPDIPNARSLHAAPVPRAGGYAIWAAFLPAALLAAPPFPGGWAGWMPSCLALVIVSGRDDVREVSVAARLGVHGLAALWSACALALAVWDGDASAWPRIVATAGPLALVLAWAANLYNFMDGTDGLAGAMGAIGFAAYGLAALGVELPSAREGALAFFALAAAIVPFLVVNRPRATMFLGDVGAVPLGFLAAAFGAAGVVEGFWPAWFPALVFLPFIADASLTLAQRMRRGERLWEGHRGHYYQRLAQLGAGHAGTLAAYAALMVGTALTALGCRVRAPEAGWWALAAWCTIVGMLFATIDYHWRKKTNVPLPE